MSRRFRGFFAVFTLLALIGAACSSSGDDGDDGGGASSGGSGGAPGAEDGGDVTGVTDDTITIGAVINDNAELADIGFAVEIGDTEEQVRTFFEGMEVAGRTVEVETAPFSSITIDTQREACLQLTQDTESFLVVGLGGFRPENILCITEENETPYFASNAADQEIFDRSGNRLFSTTLEFRENQRQAVRVFDDRGLLEDATIGVFVTDETEESQLVYEEGLKPALEDAGYEVAAEVVLPCPPGSCEQTESGVQQMIDAGVDTVFTTINLVSYASVVSAGNEADFKPQYLMTSVGNAEADILAQRMEGAGDAFDGALIVTTAPRDWTVSDPQEPEFGAECNDRYVEENGGDRAEWGVLEDSTWGAITVICSIANVVEQALEATGEDLTEERFIEAMEGLSDLPLNNVGNVGSFGPDKHYAGDAVNVLTYDLDCTCWVADGEGEAIPIE